MLYTNKYLTHSRHHFSTPLILMDFTADADLGLWDVEHFQINQKFDTEGVKRQDSPLGSNRNCLVWASLAWIPCWFLLRCRSKWGGRKVFYWGVEDLITRNDGSRQPVATVSESVLGIRPLVPATKNWLSGRSRGSPLFSGSFYRIENESEFSKLILFLQCRYRYLNTREICIMKNKFGPWIQIQNTDHKAYSCSLNLIWNVTSVFLCCPD